MGEQTKVVSELSQSAIELAKAADNLGALNLGFGVAIAIMLMMVAFFMAQVYAANKKLVNIEEAAKKTIAYFTPVADTSIGKEESKAIIRESVTRTSTMIKYGILKIRYENHLSPGSADDRIKGMIRSEHNDRKAILGRFMLKNRKLSFVCEENDNEALIGVMKEFVYMDKEKFTASLMAQEVNYLVDGIKARYQSKIDELL